MRYTVVESKTFADEWRVESVPDGDGGIEVTIFSGPCARERAKEYAVWKERSAFDIVAGTARRKDGPFVKRR